MARRVRWSLGRATGDERAMLARLTYEVTAYSFEGFAPNPDAGLDEQLLGFATETLSALESEIRAVTTAAFGEDAVAEIRIRPGSVWYEVVVTGYAAMLSFKTFVETLDWYRTQVHQLIERSFGRFSRSAHVGIHVSGVAAPGRAVFLSEEIQAQTPDWAVAYLALTNVAMLSLLIAVVIAKVF